jgi:hypothetical protein
MDVEPPLFAGNWTELQPPGVLQAIRPTETTRQAMHLEL